MVFQKASSFFLLLLLVSAFSSAHASSDPTTVGSEADLDMFLFLGETDGLEGMGVNLDEMLGIEDSVSTQGGDNNEN